MSVVPGVFGSRLETPFLGIRRAVDEALGEWRQLRDSLVTLLELSVTNKEEC